MGTGLLALLPVLTAAGGAAGSYLSTSAGISAANKQLDKQIDLQRETNEQNYKIWQESQDFAREQSDTQWQREMEMFNMENSYNNPVNVVGRLREAGINPALAMQGSLGSAMSSAASGGSPTIGNNPTPPTMQSPNIMTSPLAQLYANRATGLSDASLKASQVLKNLADAKKTGVDTTYQEKTMNDSVALNKLNVQLAALEQEKLRIGNKQIIKQIDLTEEQIKNAMLEGNLISANIHVQNALGNKYIIENEKAKAYLTRIAEFIQVELEERRAQVANTKMTTALAPKYASAALLSAAAAMKNADVSAGQLKLARDIYDHPTEIQSYLVKALGTAMTPEEVGNILRGYLDKNGASKDDVDLFINQYFTPSLIDKLVPLSGAVGLGRSLYNFYSR